MKAIVMAGGEGTRLRPLTVRRPKPMVRLLDRPVLEYILELLKKHGVTDVCLTLGYMSDFVENYLKSNDLGLNIECRVEREPLGTAGGVKACADFIGDDNCLIISGDAMCDFDIGACFAFHLDKNAEATIVLCSSDSPLEYGLVVTGRSGRIERFIEKPPWEMVCTDCINTGIYILSPEIIREIPDGKYDFGKDLFPRLLAENRRLFGIHAEGFWCDIGSPEAYLSCAFDMLDGKMRAHIAVPEVRKGVWSAVTFPKDTVITPPVYVGKNVLIGAEAHIGPYAVIGEGSRIGDGATIKSSVTDGAALGKRSNLCGAIVCKGASVGCDTSVEEGSVIGDGTCIGDRSYIMQRVKIWPNKTLPDGKTVRESIITGFIHSYLTFGSGAVIGGEFNATLTPEQCIAVGAASAEFGKVGLCCCGGEAAAIITDAISCGIRTSGGEAIRLDCSVPAIASYSTNALSLDLCIFVCRRGEKIDLLFFGGDGLPLDRAGQRRIEASISGEIRRSGVDGAGRSTSVSGTLMAYLAAAVESIPRTADMPSVKVHGAGEANRVLRRVLNAVGCRVEEKGIDLPAFEVVNGGFGLRIRDEDGRHYGHEKVLVMTALAEFEHGGGVIAVPYSAPGALDILAASLGKKLLRLERDGEEAEKLYRSQRFLRDGIFSALKLCSAMAVSGERISDMAGRIPEFSIASQTVGVSCGRAKAMRLMAAACSEMASEICEGLRVNTGRGFVSIRPGGEPNSLIVMSEAAKEEIAEELCADFVRRAKKLK